MADVRACGGGNDQLSEAQMDAVIAAQQAPRERPPLQGD
jgi:hypothetical protein